ncbi:hypothetical protein LguiA_022394 [Lonicera macranthoides]
MWIYEQRQQRIWMYYYHNILIRYIHGNMKAMKRHTSRVLQNPCLHRPKSSSSSSRKVVAVFLLVINRTSVQSNIDIRPSSSTPVTFLACFPHISHDLHVNMSVRGREARV